MALSDDALAEVVTAVWTDMLGLPMTVVPSPPDDAELSEDRQLTGCIHISSGWSGSLLVQVPEQVAQELAAAMFGMEVSELADDEVIDALGEVANMIGGNVKAIVGGAVLSLPSVTSGKSFDVRVPGSKIEASATFECQGNPARVVLLVRSE